MRGARGSPCAVFGLDVLVFRHHFWPRLMANVGVVLVFLAFYLRYAKTG